MAVHLLHFGKHLCGKVDHVPGYFYVATRVFWFMVFPIIPLESMVIVDGTERDDVGYVGVSIPLSWKSILFAWIRASALFGALCCIGPGIGVIVEEGNWVYGIELILLGIGLIGFFKATYKIAGPSPSRARDLAERLGLDPDEAMLIAMGREKLDDSED